MRRVRLAVVVAALLVSACSSTGGTTTTVDSPVTTSPVTTSPVTTLGADETTTSSVPETTTTTAAVTTSTTVDGDYETPAEFGLAPPSPIEGSEGASGSGCSPGNPMRDGVWFGLVHDIYPTSVEIDIACFWFGEIAYEVGESEGEEVANDYYVQNSNDLVREVPIATDVVVWSLAGDTSEGHAAIEYADWPIGESTYVPCPGEYCGVWIYLNDGIVTEIVEQYVP